MSLLVFGLVFIFVHTEIRAQITVNDCPPTLPRDRYVKAFGSSCYQFVTSHQRDFHSAERECESRRGHLVTVTNSGVQNFLYHTLQSEFRFDGILWIGLTDESSEGHFVWVDGSPVHYTNWADGQPGIAGFLEDCAGMDMSGTGHWFDFRCDGFLFITSEHYFVCEYPVKIIATTQTGTSSHQQSSLTTDSASHAGCPSMACGLDCGDTGYKFDSTGCLLCQCQAG